MLQYMFVGCTFGFAAAVQPGPLQAFLLSSVTSKGWKHTLPASFSPIISDGPIALLVLLVLKNFPVQVTHYLQLAGGLLLLYLAFKAYKNWKKGIEKETDENSKPQTILQAAAINILNPNPYIGWSLVLGPQVIKAWHESISSAAALILSFYGTIVFCLALIIMLFGTTTYLGEKGRKVLILFSVFALALLGIYQLYAGFTA
jgi:threonine/homoserine/homoserine lactone efflux protein